MMIKIFKERPILFASIGLTILIELIIILLVYEKIGFERIPKQLPRLIFQGLLILLIFSTRLKWPIFLLTAYHIFVGIFALNKIGTLELANYLFGYYHILIGLLIYFHDWIEAKIKTPHNNV